MNTSWKSGIAGLVGLAAIAWLALDSNGSANTLQTRSDPMTECNSRDPLSACAAHHHSEDPLGDGLVITLMEDFF